MGVLIPLGIAVALVCWLLIATMLAMITEELEQAPLELERADSRKIKVMEKWLEYEAQGCYDEDQEEMCAHVAQEVERVTKFGWHSTGLAYPVECWEINEEMKEYERRDA